MNFVSYPELAIYRNEDLLVPQEATRSVGGGKMSVVSLTGEDSEFHAKYEPREILGR